MVDVFKHIDDGADRPDLMKRYISDEIGMF